MGQECIALFFDLYGVLIDASVMAPSYRTKLAKLLVDRFGGSVRDWQDAHEVVYEHYVDEWKTAEEMREDYGLTFGRIEHEYITLLFEFVGRECPDEDWKELVANADYLVTRGVDASFADVRPALSVLRRMGVPMYLTSGASSSHCRGALEGAELTRCFVKTLNPQRLGLWKSDEEYWRKVTAAAQVPPDRSLAIDDTPRVLEAAIDAGLQTIWVRRSREQARPPGFKPKYTVGGLNGVVEIVSVQLRDSSGRLSD